MTDTEHLMRSPANRKRLSDATGSFTPGEIHADIERMANAPRDAEGYVTLTAANYAIKSAREEGRRAGMMEAAKIAYTVPHYVHGFEPDGDGLLLPGSPYDRGRYEARKAIEAKAKEAGQ